MTSKVSRKACGLQNPVADIHAIGAASIIRHQRLGSTPTGSVRRTWPPPGSSAGTADVEIVVPLHPAGLQVSSCLAQDFFETLNAAPVLRHKSRILSRGIGLNDQLGLGTRIHVMQRTGSAADNLVKELMTA
jgi:hypothetical protein